MKNRIAKNEQGFSGIGTMIIVIVMILVGTMVSASLMNSGMLLGQTAEKAGTLTKAKVSQAYKILHVYGDRRDNLSANQDEIRWLFMKVTMEPGSPEADLRQLRIELIHTDSLTVGAEFDLSLNEGYSGDTAFVSGWNEQGTPATTFKARAIRDPESLWDASTNWFVGGGSVIELAINLTDVLDAEAGLEYDTQDKLTIRLIPKHGQVTFETVRAPDAFTDRYVTLE